MPEGKTCTNCKEFKSFSEYTPHKRYKYGFLSMCKNCCNLKRKSRVGCEKTKERTRKYYAENREKILSDPKNKERSSKWVKDNKGVHNKRNRCWSENNKDYGRRKTALRRARQLEATLLLTDAQKAAINRTYKLCTLIQEITGVDYHVDHIIPLKGKNVCGLHVPWNLQVLRADLNLSKSNKYN